LVSRLRATFGVEVEPRQIFAAATPARVADVVRELAGGDQPMPLSPRAGDGPAPLSHSQRRLWFLDQLAPGNPAYHIPVAVRLRGRLDRRALATALGNVAGRHDVLRTHVGVIDGEPVQVVDPSAPMPFPISTVDADGYDPDQLAAAIAADAVRPFDLSTGPLWRASLFRVADDDHVLTVVMHHIVSDGWSLAVLTDELATGYAAVAQGRPDPVPRPAVQFADFAAWQRATLDGNAVSAQLDYWQRQLADPPTLRLPTDRPRPAVQTFSGAVLPWQLDAETTRDLRAVGRSTDATLFMVLLGAFGMLLGRRGYADDVVVGSPASGRTRLETEKLIGFFANTLPFAARSIHGAGVHRPARRVRSTCLDAYLHEEVPFELLVEAVQTGRDLSRNPLFQVVFALQNAPRPLPRLGDLDLELLDVSTATAKFDLTVSLWEEGEGLSGTLEFNSDLFDPDTVTALGAEYVELLRRVAGDPGAGLADLALPARAARPLLAAEPPPAPLGWLGGTPDAVVFAGPAGHTTYAELDAQAEDTATALRALGAGPETAVALCRPVSADWLAGLLGILRTGATCVALDPAGDGAAEAGATVLLASAEPVAVGGSGAADPDACWLGVADDGLSRVRLTVDDLSARADAVRAALDLAPGDRVWVDEPAHHERAVWVGAGRRHRRRHDGRRRRRRRHRGRGGRRQRDAAGAAACPAAGRRAASADRRAHRRGVRARLRRRPARRRVAAAGGVVARRTAARRPARRARPVRAAAGHGRGGAGARATCRGRGVAADRRAGLRDRRRGAAMAIAARRGRRRAEAAVPGASHGGRGGPGGPARWVAESDGPDRSP
jgi:hypothetical protein